MKKLILIIAMTILGAVGFAQAFDKGSQAINIDIGFVNTPYVGTDLYGGFYPSATASYEYGIIKLFITSKVNGVISIGPYVGFCKSESDKFLQDDHYNVLDYIFAIRGNYHFVFSEKFDPYAGVWLGYNYSETKWVGEWDDPGVNIAHESGPAAGAYVGARYFFGEHIGVNMEVGWLMSIVNAGITFKF